MKERSISETFVFLNKVCRLLLLVNGEEKVGAVNVRVGSCLGVSGSQDDAGLLVSQWVREVLYKQVREGFHRYEHDPMFVPLLSTVTFSFRSNVSFVFWRISSSTVSFFPLGQLPSSPPSS
ncbi:MAG: hypothetical protein ACQEXX_24370 [Bacillota bacterium]